MGTTLSLHRLVGASLLVVVQCTAADGQWIQVGGDIDGENVLDFAGGSQGALAMSANGTTLAVGANGHDGGGDEAGHVRVFDLVDGAWSARGDDIQGEVAGDRSGSSVVLSADGSVVGVGAPYSEAGNTGQFDEGFGQVQVFAWTDGSWVQRGPAIAGVASYDFASDYGGLAMDAAGDTVVVGAADHTGPNGEGAGHVRVLDWDGGGAWVQRGDDLHGHAPGDWFGAAVAVGAAGDTVAVGAPFDDGDEEAGPFGCVACRGSVRVFDWDEGAREWRQRGIDLDGERDHDKSGSAVALDAAGDAVAIGSPRSSASFDAELGSVTVYAWDGAGWQQRGARIEGEEIGDLSGSTLAISALGNTVAIGSQLNDGGSELEGHVRVFDWDGEAWLQRGSDIDGENKFDYSGYSLAMSADGDRLASGARYTDDAGYFAGHARVFSWIEPDPPAPTTTTAPPPADACGDSRFKESEDGKRHKRTLARFSRSEVGSIGACNEKCADTDGCLGTRWKPSANKPCTTLKGRQGKRCGQNTICCSLV